MTLRHRPLAQHPPRCVAPARPLTLSEHPLPHPKETCLQGPSPAGGRQADTTAGARPDHRFPEPQAPPRRGTGLGSAAAAGGEGGPETLSSSPSRRARRVPSGDQSLGGVPEAAQLSTAGAGPAAGLGVDFPTTAAPPRRTQQSPRKIGRPGRQLPARCCETPAGHLASLGPSFLRKQGELRKPPGRSQAGLQDSPQPRACRTAGGKEPAALAVAVCPHEAAGLRPGGSRRKGGHRPNLRLPPPTPRGARLNNYTPTKGGLLEGTGAWPLAPTHCQQTGACLPGGHVPAPASCPAHSLSADSRPVFKSCPLLQRHLTSIQQTGQQGDEAQSKVTGPKVTASALPRGEVAERRSLSVSWGREGEAGHPKGRAPAGPGTRLLTFGPMTAAGCWETRRHLFRHCGHVSGRFRHAAAPGRASACSSSGCMDRLGHGEGAEAAPRPWAATSPHRPAPPQLRAALTDPVLGESTSWRASVPCSRAPHQSQGGAELSGRARSGPPRPRSQHGVRPSLRAAHVP